MEFYSLQKVDSKRGEEILQRGELLGVFISDSFKRNSIIALMNEIQQLYLRCEKLRETLLEISGEVTEKVLNDSSEQQGLKKKLKLQNLTSRRDFPHEHKIGEGL